MVSGVGELLGRLDKVTSLPVFGRKIGELLEGVGVVSIEHFRQLWIEHLEKVGITREVGRGIIGLAVKMNGRE